MLGDGEGKTFKGFVKEIRAEETLREFLNELLGDEV